MILCSASRVTYEHLSSSKTPHQCSHEQLAVSLLCFAKVLPVLDDSPCTTAAKDVAPIAAENVVRPIVRNVGVARREGHWGTCPQDDVLVVRVKWRMLA